MDGYKALAERYGRMAAEIERNGNDATEPRQHEKVLAFLGTCDATEICKLFDSGAFNNIAKAYCKQAMLNVGVDDETAADVESEINVLFEDTDACSILRKKEQ